MKIRNGFVSNSSSSSFIVIDKKSEIPNTRLDDSFVIGEGGFCEFGWEQVRYVDMYSRINFAYLQALHQPEWLEMLHTVLHKHGAINISTILDKNYTLDYNDDDNDDNDNPNFRFAYIDHQSAASEGMNTEVFDSEEDLERFIFCPKSYIQGDNDNH